MRLTHARLLVGDFRGAFRFWRDRVALEAVYGDEDGPYADFAAGDGTLALFDAASMAASIGDPAPAGERGPDQAVVIFAVDDVDGAYARLTSNGVVFVAPPVDRPAWGIRAAHFRDPEGNLVEINAPLGEPSTMPA
jgi:lactoylglutathione lyase